MAAKKKKARTAAKKTTPRATTAKKKSTKPAVTQKRTASQRKGKAAVSKSAKSVDVILRKFDKERVAQQTQLAAVQKQIKALTAKIKASEKQLNKLQKQNVQTQHTIATLDSRRDAEIGKLLSSMGVNLDSAASAAESAKRKKVDKPTPLFDQSTNSVEKAANNTTVAKSPAGKSPSNDKAKQNPPNKLTKEKDEPATAKA